MTAVYSFLFCYCREIEACNGLLTSLCNGFSEAIKSRAKCERGSLIPSGEYKAIGFFNMSAAVNQFAFYGRCAGFQVSVKNVIVKRLCESVCVLTEDSRFEMKFYLLNCLFSLPVL